MKRRRVKITGIGPVTPAGIGVKRFWEGMLSGQSFIRPFKKGGPEFGPLIAAYMPEFEIGDYVKREELPNGVARHTLLAVAAAVLALEDAGLPKQTLATMTSAVISGTSLMDFAGIVREYDSIAKRGVRGVMPRVIFTAGLVNVVETVCIMLGINARTMVMQSSCCSGLDAIGYAGQMVAEGEVDVAICGGTEAPVGRNPLIEFRGAGLTPWSSELPEQAVRPFDLWRTTGVVSEGACMFVLEPEESPRPGYAWLRGWASANDERGNICGGLETAGRLALAQSEVRPCEIDMVQAWGPGHRVIDKGEAAALGRLFGKELGGLPVVSIKGAVGSTLGASGAIDLAAAAMALREGAIPATVNWERPDPECPLNLGRKVRSLAVQTALVNAHGFGNLNSCAVLERC